MQFFNLDFGHFYMNTSRRFILFYFLPPLAAIQWGEKLVVLLGSTGWSRDSDDWEARERERDHKAQREEQQAWRGQSLWNGHFSHLKKPASLVTVSWDTIMEGILFLANPRLGSFDKQNGSDSKDPPSYWTGEFSLQLERQTWFLLLAFHIFSIYIYKWSIRHYIIIIALK